MALQILSPCPAQSTDLGKNLPGSLLVAVAVLSATALTYELHSSRFFQTKQIF